MPIVSSSTSSRFIVITSQELSSEYFRIRTSFSERCIFLGIDVYNITSSQVQASHLRILTWAFMISEWR